MFSTNGLLTDEGRMRELHADLRYANTEAEAHRRLAADPTTGPAHKVIHEGWVRTYEHNAEQARKDIRALGGKA